MANSDPTGCGLFSGDCEWIAAQLRAAWPGVRRLKLKGTVEIRELGACDAEQFSDRLRVEIGLTASEAELLALGLVTADELAAIPPSGAKHFCWALVLKRTGSGLRLNSMITDPAFGDLSEREQRMWDAMARAIAPAVWTPPSRRQEA